MSHECGYDEGATVINCYWCGGAIDYRDSVERLTVELPVVCLAGSIGAYDAVDVDRRFHDVRECLECCESHDRFAWGLLND